MGCTALQDDQIQQALGAGNPEAIEWLWDVYGSGLYGYLRTILFSVQDAEDTLQDVFVKAARHHSRLARARNLKAYLFRMARNLAITRIRKQDRTEPLSDDHWLEAEPEIGLPTEWVAALQAGLARLPEKQRSVVALKVYQGLTFAEIASALRIRPNTAASRYRYGIEKLTQSLQEEFADEHD